VAGDQGWGVAVKIMAGKLVATTGQRPRYRWQKLDIACTAAVNSFVGGRGVCIDGQQVTGEQHGLEI